MKCQVISSFIDVAESFISLLARGFRFEGGRLRIFERRTICIRRKMKMIWFFKLLALGFMNLRLNLSSTKFTLAFISDLVLELSLCWSSIWIAFKTWTRVRSSSCDGGLQQRLTNERIYQWNETLVIFRELIFFRLKVWIQSWNSWSWSVIGLLSTIMNSLKEEVNRSILASSRPYSSSSASHSSLATLNSNRCHINCLLVH